MCMCMYIYIYIYIYMYRHVCPILVSPFVCASRVGAFVVYYMYTSFAQIHIWCYKYT